MKSYSIRHTLLLRCGFGVGLLLCFLSLGIYFTVRHGLYREIDESISQAAAILANQVELEHGKIIFEWQEGIGTNPNLPDKALFQFWNETNGTTTRSPALKTRDLPQFCGPAGTPRIMDISLPGENHSARALGMRIYPFVLPEEIERMKSEGPWIDPKSIPHLLVVVRDTAQIHEVLIRLRWILGIGTALTLAAGFGLIHFVIKQSLRPIEVLAQQVRELRERELDPRLEIPRSLPAELTGLTNEFESLLVRLSSTRRRERDFIHHAAHELRTPIAGLLATLELALSKDRDADSYAAHLESCRSSAEDLNLLVRRLSALAKISGSDAVTPSPLDLTDLARQCVDSHQPRLAPRNLTLDCQWPQAPAIALADRALTLLVCNNLLDNAICYARSGGLIQLQISRHQNTICLAVRNPADDLPEDPERLFEPLFRGNSSRSDASSHLGIGLTLSRDAARAMHGSLEVLRHENGDVSFTLTLPAI